MRISEAVDRILEECPDVPRAKVKRAFASALKEGKDIATTYSLVKLTAQRGLLVRSGPTITAFDATGHEAQLRTDTPLKDEYGLLPGAKTQQDPSRTVAKHAAAGV